RSQRSSCEPRRVERVLELARCVVACPDRPTLQRDRHEPTGKSYARACQVAATCIESNLPGADTPDDRCNKHPAVAQPASDLAGGIAQVRHAVQRAEVGVGRVESKSGKAIELLDSKMADFDAVLEPRATDSVASLLDHCLRPIDRSDAKPSASQRFGVASRP